MKLLARFSVALITFLFGCLLTWVGSTPAPAQPSLLSAPQPESITYLDAEPGSLKWYVLQAKERGESETGFTSIACGLAVDSLKDSLRRYSLAVVRPVESHTYAANYGLHTWYKFRLIELLSLRPGRDSIQQRSKQLSLPAKLLPLKEDEFLLSRLGGVLLIDGVRVTHRSNSHPFQLEQDYLLFLDYDRPRSLAIVPWLNGRGVFRINAENQLIDVGVFDRLSEEINRRYGNSLLRLKAAMLKNQYRER